MLACSKCGALVATGHAFCASCGHRAKRRGGKVLTVLIALLVPAGVLVAWIALQPSDPDPLVQEVAAFDVLPVVERCQRRLETAVDHVVFAPTAVAGERRGEARTVLTEGERETFDELIEDAFDRRLRYGSEAGSNYVRAPIREACRAAAT